MIELLPAAPDDIESVHRLFAAALPEVWSKQALLAECSHPFASFFVAKKEGHVVGFYSARFVFGDGELQNIAVDKALRGQGIGRALMERLLLEAARAKTEQITLEVRDSNRAACALYEAMGFVLVGKRARFYEHPVEDARLYQRKLEV